LKEEEKFYVVQSGDNPWKIAKKFHISFEKLLQLNNLNEKRARVLKVGERLKIREDS
jgi:LysM repeat protein